MEIKPGIWVRNPRQPAWGAGRVADLDGSKVRVVFLEAGEKLLDTQFVALEEAETPADAERERLQIRARKNVDMGALARLCRQFHEQFRDRRSNTDDGRMGINVLEDMRARGDLTRETARQLFSWCHTGASYTEGVDLAQQICRLIYDHVPTRAEIEASGL